MYAIADCEATNEAIKIESHAANVRFEKFEIPRKIPTMTENTDHKNTAVMKIFRIVISGFGGSSDALTPLDPL